MIGRIGMALAAMLLVAACGGGGGGGGTSVTPTAGATAGAGGGTATGGPSATNAGCSLRARQDWAAAQLREWYLFPDRLATGVDPARYATVDDYVDALTAPARAERRDRNFTYLTSIREEDAYFDDGVSEGYGFQLAFVGDRLMVADAYEDAPALAAGIDRGTAILAIGSNAATARSISDLLSTGGGQAVADALGNGRPGETIFLRVLPLNALGQRDVTLTAARYTLQPVSPRFGARVLDTRWIVARTGADGRTVFGESDPVGYVNLRTFVASAEAPLRQAFARFRAAGLRHVVIDLRNNGGGLVSIGQLLTDLIGGERTANDVQGRTAFRPEKSGENRVRYYAPQPEAMAPLKVAFLTNGQTASASEFVINATTPWLGANAIMLGGNTYGKPVGQIAVDRAECDDRLRIVAFATQNSAGQGDYYDGLAGRVPASCAMFDSPFDSFGPNERLTTQATYVMAHGLQSCTPITAARQSADAGPRSLPPDPLHARRPKAAQRHIEGLF